MGHYELHSWIILLLGWVFVPFYMRSSVFTMPEFLERRYSSEARWILSIISLIGYVLTKVSATVYAGAVVFQTLMGIEFWSGALIIVLLTGAYTILGGLRANRLASWDDGRRLCDGQLQSQDRHQQTQQKR